MKRFLLILLALLALTLSGCGDSGRTETPDIPALTLPESTAMPTAPPTEPPAPAVESSPEPLPESYELTLGIAADSNADTARLLDRSYETKLSFGGGEQLRLDCGEEIFSLYLIWDLPPGSWSVGGESFGENGFIHEYVSLREGAKELSLTLPADGATLCDIYAFSFGEPPDWVQQWQPPLDKADILLMPTHADDEHLFFGGIMPYYAGELGYSVQVAYLTNHWNEPPRPHELLNGLWTVGITAYPVIGGFNDLYAGSLAEAKGIYSLDEVLEFQVWLLRRFKPLVVVNHDVDGEYGHGVHILNAHAIQTAVELAADSGSYPESAGEYGVWDTPKLYLHLWPENELIMNWDIPLERFGGATAFEMAVAGYDCHKSQHIWSFAVRQEGDPYDCRRFGLLRSTVGPDTAGNDLLENVSPR